MRARRVITIALSGLVALVALDLAFPPPLERAQELSAMVESREGAPLRAFPLEDGRWRLKADLDRIDPAFVEALIAVEDKRFHHHLGVDPAAVMRAGVSAAKAGEVVSGASTITMQTARLLEPRPRTLGSKAIEMLRAFQLERRLSKREILEVYLTLAPYGGNLEGVRAASHAYFGRPPQALTPEEIALLIALPQAPEARRPDLRPDAAMAARADMLDKLAALELVSEQRAEEAKRAAAPKRGGFPNRAWHGAARARLGQAPGDVRSTLDRGLQFELEVMAMRAAADAGVDVQVSMLVIDLDGRAVRAAVGSASRDRPGGWLDLTARARSPGSTLKPFLFALAFDDGIAGPDTRIDDLPSRFAGYRPENFDRRFRGEVRVREALQHSLNIPAVTALERVGAARFAATLDFAGAAPMSHRRAEGGPGLALALGGAGLTGQDLAMLYAALGDRGRAKPLAWTEKDATIVRASDGVRVMSAETAGEIMDILTRAPSPGGRAPSWLTENTPEIAFKTGTSYGYRDAWAAGVADGRAAIVWVGRADGAPRPGVTGRAAALPILFDMFDRAAVHLGRGERASAIVTEARASTGTALKRFERDGRPPVILFPPDGADVLAPGFGETSRGLVLAGRGAGPLAWYVDGVRTPLDAGGAPVWRPKGPGFYEVKAVDLSGRATRSAVRILPGGG